MDSGVSGEEQKLLSVSGIKWITGSRDLKTMILQFRIAKEFPLIVQVFVTDKPFAYV